MLRIVIGMVAAGVSDVARHLCRHSRRESINKKLCFNIYYESIYRLVLITHQSRGPVAGAIAGKRRSGILGPCSPRNQPCWVLALVIPAP